MPGHSDRVRPLVALTGRSRYPSLAPFRSFERARPSSRERAALAGYFSRSWFVSRLPSSPRRRCFSPTSATDVATCAPERSPDSRARGETPRRPSRTRPSPGPEVPTKGHMPNGAGPRFRNPTPSERAIDAARPASALPLTSPPSAFLTSATPGSAREQSPRVPALSTVRAVGGKYL
jgi:hypothetical protein